MSMIEAGISFRELLAYNHSETLRWKNWFEKNPNAWDVSVGGNASTVRGMVLHIFQAEYWFAARLLSQEASKEKLEPNSIGDMFTLHDEAHKLLSQYIAGVDEEELRRIEDIPFIAGLKVSNRKMLAQALIHGIHHWAQVAIEVRQAGMPSDGPHDLILSPVME